MDECVKGERICDPNAERCVNTLGSSMCVCKAGYMNSHESDSCVGK